jgi:hypothetical protein
MRRHCERESIAGIPNFMHIALAMGNVLSAQVERALIGLETTRSPLTAEAWHEHRQRLEKHLVTFRNVVAILDEYASWPRRLPSCPMRCVLSSKTTRTVFCKH